MTESPGGRAAAVRLVGATALLFVLPVSFLAAYVGLLGAPIEAVGPHLWTIAAMAAGLAGARLFLSLLPLSADMRRLLSACLICAVLVGLACLYAASVVGLKFWGRVASVNLVSTYVAQAPALLRTLGFEPAVIYCVIAIPALAGIAIIYFVLMRYDWVPAFRARVSTATSVVAAAGLCSIFGAWMHGFEDHRWGSKGEPLSLSLYPWQGDRDMESHRIDVFRSKQLLREDERARASYVLASSGPRSNVILIVVDALRADHLSLLGYSRKNTPKLEELRDKGAMNLAAPAMAVCNESFCGLQALASSRYVDQQSEAPITLHEVLKKHGYRVHLIFGGDHTNFYGIDRIYGPVDSYFDGASQKARYVNDDRLVIDRLASFPQWDRRPTMFQFHLMSTHALGERFADTPEFGPGASYAAVRRGTSAEESQRLSINHYDRGVLQADAVISKLLGQLDERGYLEDAVVVITGDHGESLGERGRYSHAHSVWQEGLRVPFIVLTFGKANTGNLKPRPVISQIDIAPSVLHMLGLPQPTTWQGVPIQLEKTRRYIHFQQANAIGLMDEASPGGLLKHWVDALSGEQYTFNVTTDPGEKDDLTDKVPVALRQQWRGELMKHAGALSAEAQQRLREQRPD